MPYIILAVILILDFAFIMARSKAGDKKGLILKLMASINFIILGVVCYFYNKSVDQTYSILILFGLAFGLLGDLMLGIRRLSIHKNIFFISGMSFFLIGHIIYISAFVNLGSIDYFMLLIFTVSLFIIAIIIGYKAKFVFKKLKYCILSYLLTSSLLFSLTLTVLLSSRLLVTRNVINVTAACLFVISDAILCFIYFKKYSSKTMTKLSIISSLCYFFAQNIFALSILL